MDAVDLYLLHWPHELRLESWRVLEQLHGEGLARSIGVLELPRAPPRRASRGGFDASRREPDRIESLPLPLAGGHGSPLRGGGDRASRPTAHRFTKGRRLDDSTVASIAAEVGRTSAQVLIRWSLQKGFIVLPRSSNADRIAENARVFDFALNDAQMAELDALDEGLTTGWAPARA